MWCKILRPECAEGMEGFAKLQAPTCDICGVRYDGLMLSLARFTKTVSARLTHSTRLGVMSEVCCHTSVGIALPEQ